ncbi:MAG: polysaccharide biosynthesis/export family protein [Phycisphaerales bacterium]|nr:polysaccharide biosynthesis/export family protein [Phycisphaerales bacterium]MCB9862195.1 polysaccharide biosynthesis/export family protein [Phycisphaerales bacterium]
MLDSLIRKTITVNTPNPVQAPMTGHCRVTGLTAFCLVLVLAGCSKDFRIPSWINNGFLDPSQAGNYRNGKTTEILSVMSLLEEPDELIDAEEPSAEDLEPMYVEPKLNAGDILRVSIFELLAPGVTSEQQFQVRSSGEETFPSLGPVRIAGLTPRELELELKRLLSERQILDNADVQVSVLRSEGQQFTIVGSIQQPGNYPITRPDYRLMNAVGAVGGLPTQVDTIYIFRRDEGAPPSSGASMGDAQARRKGLWSDQNYTLSDMGRGPNGPTRVAQAGPRNSELDRLESGPIGGPAAEPVFDPTTGEWKVVESTKIPSIAPARPMPTTVPVTPNTPTTMPDEEISPEMGGSDVRIIAIPAKALLAGDPKYNVVIRPGDLIRVRIPNIGQYYMGGNVQSPGPYQLDGRALTVKQALVSAGGFGPLAEPSRANLVRRISKDEEQTIQIDLDAIIAGDTPDFYVRPNDTINVGSTPIHIFLAVLRNAFRMSYGFGFVYDRNFADSDTFSAREQTRQRELQESQLRGLPI